MIKTLSPANWTAAKVEFDRWRTSGQSIFPPEVWTAADEHHGYQWWFSFGDDFRYLNDLAIRVLSKPISASACEFNWSDVSHVISKKSNRLSDKSIEAKVNVRAMHRLEESVDRKVLLGNIPRLDDFLDALVNEAIEHTANAGDDVPDAEELEEDSSDDEDYDVVGEVGEEDADICVNTDLEVSVGTLC